MDWPNDLLIEKNENIKNVHNKFVIPTKEVSPKNEISALGRNDKKLKTFAGVITNKKVHNKFVML